MSGGPSEATGVFDKVSLTGAGGSWTAADCYQTGHPEPDLP